MTARFALFAATAALFSASAFAQEIVVIEPAPGPVYYYTTPAEPAVVVTDTAVANPVIYEDRVYVEGRRASDDQLITNDVVYALVNDPRITGTIGVDTFRSNVTLTGRVSTPGQRDRAGRDANAVDGVREVNNLIRPRVGEF